MWRLDRIALEGLADNRSHIITLGEEEIHLDHPRLENLRHFVRSQLGVGFEHDFAGRGVDDIAGSPRALKVTHVNFNLADLRLLNFLENCGIDLAS